MTKLTKKQNELLELLKGIAEEVEISLYDALTELDEDWGYENYTAVEQYIISN